MYKEYLKKHILEARIEAKISKREFARMVNVSLPTYYKYEKTGECSAVDLFNMLKALNLSIVILPKHYLTSR